MTMTATPEATQTPRTPRKMATPALVRFAPNEDEIAGYESCGPFPFLTFGDDHYWVDVDLDAADGARVMRYYEEIAVDRQSWEEDSHSDAVRRDRARCLRTIDAGLREVGLRRVGPWREVWRCGPGWEGWARVRPTPGSVWL